MEPSRRGEAQLVEHLLRRARVVVGHHRHHRQPLDARAIAARVLDEHERRHRDGLARYRPLLEQAVHALIHGLR